MFFTKNCYRILEQMKVLNDTSILQLREIKSLLIIKIIFKDISFSY